MPIIEWKNTKLQIKSIINSANNSSLCYINALNVHNNTFFIFALLKTKLQAASRLKTHH